ncbi:MAG: hypothetical protein U1D30_17245 [Planctomycetota bacterium]
MAFFGIFADRKSQDVERFMMKILNHSQLRESANVNGRQEKRVPIAMGIRVTPCVQGNKPDPTQSFDAVTKDMHTEGISFTHRRQFGGSERVVITLEHEEIVSLLCEVQHCSEIGRGMFLTGCAILERLREPLAAERR